MRGLLDPVFKEKNLSGFGVGVLGRKSFEASQADSSIETGRQEGCFDDQGNSMGDNLEVFVHQARQTSSKAYGRSVYGWDCTTERARWRWLSQGV